MGFFEIFAAALAGLYAVVPMYGLAIILLTVAVRLILLPLSIKQTRSMREMQRIQPEVKKIQQKYKGNRDQRQKMNEEMMALYKEHGVNPFGGCLPLLLQFPVFIALYRVLLEPLRYMGFGEGAATGGIMAAVKGSALATALDRNPLEVNRFLGIRLDCSAGRAGGWQEAAEGIAPCGDGVVNALPYLFLLGLMGLTTWYQQKQMQTSRTSTDAQTQQMQTMMKVMPLILVVFGFGFPAGLLLYWLTTNLWTIGQQRLMMQSIGEPVSAAVTKEEGKKGPKKGEKKPPQGDGRAAGARASSGKKKRRR